jgi:plasmid rolling circle replication initiator protein Rep
MDKFSLFNKYRLDAERLADIYDVVNPDKADRLRDCGLWVTYSEDMKVKGTNFCRVRLCPVCNWRRSLKIFTQISKIMNAMSTMDKKYKYIMLTLTVPSVEGDKLSDTITQMMKAIERLFKRKALNPVKGYFRAMRVTHNVDRKSESYNMYHPYFHFILVVMPSYFDGSAGGYLSQAKWGKLWTEAMRAEQPYIVDSRRIKGDVLTAVARVAKYSVGAADILCDDDDLSLETVKILDSALNNRRFVGMGGLFKKLHRELNLTDMEDDEDLIDDVVVDGLEEEKMLMD